MSGRLEAIAGGLKSTFRSLLLGRAHPFCENRLDALYEQSDFLYEQNDSGGPRVGSKAWNTFAN
jgi:hypothetical protein